MRDKQKQTPQDVCGEASALGCYFDFKMASELCGYPGNKYVHKTIP